jgi:metal-responsive CopG/Arc/MetJ family transcriptional regulator
MAKRTSRRRPAKQLTFVRLPPELIDALDRFVEQRQAAQPWATVTRSDAIRQLLYQALGEDIHGSQDHEGSPVGR